MMMRTRRHRWSLPTLLLLLSALFESQCSSHRPKRQQRRRRNEQNQQSNSQYYYQQISNCEDAVVQVTALQVYCNSPYTFYYGNGAHRDSIYCEYGDKLTLSASLYVTDNLNYNNDDSDAVSIYVTMAALTSGGKLLASTEPANLCDNYIGYDCTSAGSYTFNSNMRLSYANNSTSQQFVPTIQMAFSTQADGGYNLGAVNTECENWGDLGVADWTTQSRFGHTPVERFLIRNTLLLTTCILLAAFSTYVYKRARATDEDDGIDYQGRDRRMGFLD